MTDVRDEKDRPVPDVLGILPLRNAVVFPHAVVPLGAGRASSLRLIEEALAGSRLVGAVLQRDASDDAPGAAGLYTVGTVVVIHKAFKQADGTLRLIVQGLERFRIVEIVQESPYLRARIEHIADDGDASPTVEVEALARSALGLFQKVVSLSPTLPDELANVAAAAEGASALADLIASSLPTLPTALRELDRLAKMPPAAAEYTVARTYIDWLVSMPWQQATIDNVDIEAAKAVLDADHEGLEKVKDRILEYLAVKKIRPSGKDPILCFVGPPGVGKTSLGRSIARALGRKFHRISLGGMRDEAEIRGHRRTYIGALPGQIIQGLRRAGTRNPVFMLDEIDKLGMDFRGDPASALLEVLDPEQNVAFRDHYIDVPFDLSKALFITTANLLDTVPPALRDRMEIIELPGYTEEEKVRIAGAHLVPKQAKDHGLLEGEHIRWTDAALARLVRYYTREAGLRNLEREIASVCRKVARRRAEGHTESVRITPDLVTSFLGMPRFELEEVEERTRVPGVAIGLAWTPAGGDILFIEATRMKGARTLTLTGQLGDVMKESVQAALSWVRSHAEELHIAPEFWEMSDIHVHVPAGAIPKDGPSAGVTMTTALVSLLSRRRVRSGLAMTGEVSLTGRVLPGGGIKEKVLAAPRAGIPTVLLPRRNAKNLLEDVPPRVRDEMTIHLVDSVPDVLRLALEDVPTWPEAAPLVLTS